MKMRLAPMLMGLVSHWVSKRRSWAVCEKVYLDSPHADVREHQKELARSQKISPVMQRGEKTVQTVHTYGRLKNGKAKEMDW